ncbi:MAG: hypothetical protein RBT63_08740 [Bdellovibrionales bacterium]|jgi:ZIP family zinc transporter|nr:hypothetical protein [Bdellovibrionales bacterium]
MAQTLGLAIIGGTVSLLSTGLGASISPRVLNKQTSLGDTRRWLDFALGLMLSSVAFSLIGPELLHAQSSTSFFQVVAATLAGVGLIAALHLFIDRDEHTDHSSTPIAGRELSIPSSSSKLLALALIFHNFPEGMGAGASLAGMPLLQALPLQAGLATQNIAEGAMLAVCFVGFGWSWKKAIIGSWLSGAVEFLGAVAAGFSLKWSSALLSPLLAFAGGAMLTSVLIDLREREQRPALKPFLSGLIVVPLLNFVL